MTGERTPTVEGPRACRASEYDETVALINEIFRKDTGQDYSTDYPLVVGRSRLEFMRVVKTDGKVVAHVALSPPRQVVALDDRFTIGIISATVTHPDYRRRGFATRCLQDCIRLADAEGWALTVLWTGVQNFSFYRRSDYEPVASQGWMYRLGAEDAGLFRAGPYRVVPLDPSDTRHLAAVMRIHDAEPYRVARSPEEYRVLFSLPRIPTFLATAGSEVSAYLTFGEGMNKPGIIEAGGTPEALETLVGHVLEARAGPGPTQALVPLTPTALGALLEERLPERRRPVEEVQAVGHQMVRVHSLKAVLHGIRNHLRRASAGLHGKVCLACEESGEAVTLRFRDGQVDLSDRPEGERMVLSRRELARLIFGAHTDTEPVRCGGPAGRVLERVFPYYFPIWELDHA